VSGLDAHLAHLADGAGTLAVLVVAVLLGLRHATDPDHLTAVSTLVMSDRVRGVRQAGRLGLAWGTGHASTLIALGTPAVLARRLLPESAERVAEGLIGVVIVALALRLLVRWRRGRSGDVVALGRNPAAAFGIGLLHGAGGSAGVALLVIGVVPGPGRALVALVLFAVATAASMAALSAGLGRVLGGLALRPGLAVLTPAFGATGLLFGAWYALGALGGWAG
jgi:hypothetical protein